jgi:hypothetical protein
MSYVIATGILAAACEATGLTPAEIRTKSRKHRFAHTRQAVMYALHRRTGWSSPKIARYVGITDHTTALHAFRVVAERIPLDLALKSLVNLLMWSRPRVEILKDDFTVPNLRVAPELPIEKVKHLFKPPKPVRERIEMPRRFHSFTVNEYGFDAVEEAAQSDFIAGSAALADAILRARQGIAA